MGTVTIVATAVMAVAATGALAAVLTSIMLARHGRKEPSLGETPFGETMEKTDLPVISLMVRKVGVPGYMRANMLLDTGSNKSIVDSAFLLENGVAHKVRTDLAGVMNVDGQEEDGLVQCDIVLRCGENDLVDTFIMKDMSGAFGTIKEHSGVEINGIIGNIFMRKYRYLIDFDRMLAYGKGEKGKWK